MTVIVDRNHLALEDVLELLEVDNKSRDRVGLARDRYFERVVMSVALPVRALAEDAPVLLFAPRRIEVEVSGGKFGFSSEQNHTKDKCNERTLSPKRLDALRLNQTHSARRVVLSSLPGNAVKDTVM